jgi:hypothetical protein
MQLLTKLHSISGLANRRIKDIRSENILGARDDLLALVPRVVNEEQSHAGYRLDNEFSEVRSAASERIV